MTMNRTGDLKPSVKRQLAVKKHAAKPASASSALSRTGRSPRAAVGKPPRKAASVKHVKISTRGGHRDTTAAMLLGVADERERLSWTKLVAMIRHGVSPSAVDALTGFLDISQSELSDALDIPLRTLVRRKGAERLPSDESAKLVRVARVIERAEDVFEDPDAARDWLTSPNSALDGETPVSLLDTEIGAEAVMDTLGRIEHGVFA
jgi:putative toxin-antitoxin system antitoxin component (TIGR02293 family)